MGDELLHEAKTLDIQRYKCIYREVWRWAHELQFKTLKHHDLNIPTERQAMEKYLDDLGYRTNQKRWMMWRSNVGKFAKLQFSFRKLRQMRMDAELDELFRDPPPPEHQIHDEQMRMQIPKDFLPDDDVEKM
jgi:hypothetical protein